MMFQFHNLIHDNGDNGEKVLFFRIFRSHLLVFKVTILKNYPKWVNCGSFNCKYTVLLSKILSIQNLENEFIEIALVPVLWNKIHRVP